MTQIRTPPPRAHPAALFFCLFKKVCASVSIARQKPKSDPKTAETENTPHTRTRKKAFSTPFLGLPKQNKNPLCTEVSIMAQEAVRASSCTLKSATCERATPHHWSRELRDWILCTHTHTRTKTLDFWLCREQSRDLHAHRTRQQTARGLRGCLALTSIRNIAIALPQLIRRHRTTTPSTASSTHTHKTRGAPHHTTTTPRRQHTQISNFLRARFVCFGPSNRNAGDLTVMDAARRQAGGPRRCAGTCFGPEPGLARFVA